MPASLRPLVTPLIIALLMLPLLAAPRTAMAHCQVPCGIFDDELKFQELLQHTETIAKAMREITKLSDKDDAQSQQQLARWVMNKESHAKKIQYEVQAYFLAQRIKFPQDESEHEAYTAKLIAAHRVTVMAMKCKQTLDLKAAEALEEAIHAFRAAYFGPAAATQPDDKAHTDHGHSHDGDDDHHH